MIIVIDNYDSFAYNLYQYLGELGWESAVYRNDKITLEDIEQMNPSHIVISPGPCTPVEAGISNDVIGYFSGRIPILGVCLGHQCIGYVYGAKIVHAPIPTHGKGSSIFHDGRTIYKKLPNPFDAGRYHSLVVAWDNRVVELEATAYTADRVNMGIRHKRYVIEGIQFHPESIMTEMGHRILANFLAYTGPIWPEDEHGGDSLSQR
jgi:anthranilate synthase/aminodeoxychorismate synthase-like glutamine amidotransferase